MARSSSRVRRVGLAMLALVLVVLYRRLILEDSISCTIEALIRSGRGIFILEEASCQFLDGRGRGPVALASFPGSGNTWVRGLLEKATGICTGSIYCDFRLRPSFPGETIHDGSVLAAKTHNTNIGNFKSAIFIMRDIRDAMISNWNRIKSLNSHTQSVGPQHFYENEDWDRFVHDGRQMWKSQVIDSVFHWQTMMITWSEYAMTQPLLVVHYEDLKTDTVGEVQKMVEFLGMPSSRQELAQRLKEDYTEFHRTKVQDFEHYTPDQKEFLNELVADTKRKLVEKGLQDIFQLEKYMKYMLIVIGTFIGGIILGSFYIDDCNRDKEPPFRFTPELFFLYLLPPIVLESGYFLDNRAFFENIVTICVYALVGTIWNAFALGFTLYGLYQAGAILVGLNVKFTVSSALLFGTICAAVDPVAVLAVFEEIHVNKLLHILVFGESLLNDAVTIVLFNLLGAFANRPFDPAIGDNERDITVVDVFIGIAQFFVVVIASVIIGILVGMAAAFITRFSEHVHVLEPIIVFVMGYLSYILADLFQLSGIVSLIFCAIVMKHYVEANISRKSHTTIKYSLKVLSNVSEMIIFLFLGLSLYDATVHNWDWGLSLFTVFFALLFRPIGVIVLTLILNIFRVRKIGVKSIFVMSYSGLRGAVAFALALSRIFEEDALQDPDDPVLENELTLRRTMLTSVTFLLLFTVFIQGTTIKPLARRIGVKTLQEQKPTMNAAILGTSIDHVMSGIEDILGHFGHNRIREWMQRIDSKYLRWIFERYPEARDEEIYHTFKRLQYKESNEAAEKNLVFEYRKDDMGSHISLHVEAECEQVVTNEDCIPELNDVLNTSFLPPHENHLRHMLPRDERDHHQDHRFEPVNTQRNLLEYKRGRRRAKHRRTQRFGRQGTQESINVSPSRLAEFEEAEISLEEFGHVSSQEALTPKQTPTLLECVETDV